MTAKTQKSKQELNFSGSSQLWVLEGTAGKGMCPSYAILTSFSLLPELDVLNLAQHEHES